MKRFLLLSMVLGLFAGQASAGPYTLTQAYALTLDDVAYSDGGAMDALSPTTSTDTYGLAMQGQVGFFGSLDDTDGGDKLASVTMGDPGANLSLNLSSQGYTEYRLFMANDDDDLWSVALYIKTLDGLDQTPFVELAGYSSATLVLDFATFGIVDAELADVDDIGFIIQGDLKFSGSSNPGYPSDPDFYHVSVVPVPAAVILGLLGLGVAGWKLRRFA